MIAYYLLDVGKKIKKTSVVIGNWIGFAVTSILLKSINFPMNEIMTECGKKTFLAKVTKLIQRLDIPLPPTLYSLKLNRMGS